MPMARPFVVCEVGSGITASFWFDNWTSLGPLIEITGKIGPKSSGLPINAVVANGLRGNEWWISASRIRNPIIKLLLQCLPSPETITNSENDDQYLWKIGANQPLDKFSTSATWHYLHLRSRRWIGSLQYGSNDGYQSIRSSVGSMLET